MLKIGMVLAAGLCMSIQYNVQFRNIYANQGYTTGKSAAPDAPSFDKALSKILSYEGQQKKNDDLLQLSQQYVRLLTSTILSQLGQTDTSRPSIDDIIRSNHTPQPLTSIPTLSTQQPIRPNEPVQIALPEIKEKADTPFAEIIQKAARTYGLDTGLIRAVIQTESNFDPKAVSHAGAQGLMQLMPETAKDLSVDDAFNPEQNIMAGSRYLKQLLQRYDNKLEPALAAYNWGMGNLERHPDRLPQETRSYITKITGILERATA